MRMLQKSALTMFALFCIAAADQSSLFNYLHKKDNKTQLTQKLALRESQDGIAGSSVHEWQIEKDGIWYHTSYLLRNDTLTNFKYVGKGKLNSRQIEQLSKILHQQDLLNLPATQGKDAAGSHEYSISFGDNTFILYSAPTRRGGKIDQNIKQAKGVRSEKALNRYAEIAQTIVDLAK